MADSVNDSKNIKRIALVVYAISAIFLVVSYFVARDVYRMWSWPGANAELINIVIETDSDGYPSYYGEVQFKTQDNVVFLAELKDPIDDNYQKGETIRIAYNPQNPTDAMKFSFFFSFSPLVWIAFSLGLMYIARIIWLYKPKPTIDHAE